MLSDFWLKIKVKTSLYSALKRFESITKEWYVWHSVKSIDLEIFKNSVENNWNQFQW